MDLGPLRAAQQALAKSSEAFEAAYQSAAARGDVFGRPSADLRRLNKLLYQSERALTHEEGLPRRAWFKHQLYAPGFYTGYGVKTVPYVREALEEKHWDEARKGVEVVRQRLLDLAARIDSASRMLE